MGNKRTKQAELSRVISRLSRPLAKQIPSSADLSHANSKLSRSHRVISRLGQPSLAKLSLAKLSQARPSDFQARPSSAK